MDDGNGLIKGGDWVGYHHVAVRLSEQIDREGWSAWELRPEEQPISGLVGAIYAATGINKPWILIPFNAAIHATSALILLAIIMQITAKFKTAFLAMLPFALFPTAFLWNSALHKDGIFILGFILALYGLNRLANTTPPRWIRALLKSALSLTSGLYLVWVVRPYGIEMLIYVILAIAVPLTVYLLFIIRRHPYLLFNIILLWVIPLMMLPLSMIGLHHRYAEPNIAVLEEYLRDENNEFSDLSQTSTGHQNEKTENETNLLQQDWIVSGFLPDKIEKTLYTLSINRDVYRTIGPYAGSNIDVDVQFISAADVIFYIPRALQIGLLAPFPNQWLTERSGFGLIMHRIAGIEMFFVYFALLFVPVAFCFWYKKPELYLTAALPLGMILTYALVVVNLGTLHRMRYGFLMTLVAIGVAAVAELIERYFRNRATS